MKKISVETIEEIDVIREMNIDVDDCYRSMNELLGKAAMWGMEYSEHEEYSEKDMQTQLWLSSILEACEYIELACNRIDKAIGVLDRMWLEDDGE